MEKIIPFLTSRLSRKSININREGIKKVLISLIKQKLIVEGINLTKNDVLLNQNRKNIYRYIKSSPGTFLNRIISELKLSNHVVYWHLSILMEFEFIERKKIESQPVYFVKGINFEKVKQNFVISKKKSQEIIEYLRNNAGGITKTQLKKTLSMHHNTITRYIDELEDINLIIKKEVGKRELYFLKK